ncbi:hypothetical protein [Jannaschia donghaensis]|uniref:Uncharacterized protein n=1 Tax=Jannaschia donghaensis TaxID=420998 RepID=A0A0M6YP50_9RHOB|nr:hypothetical protein [Jannaschia donghaensis]CTQ51027.1 hypothetical protein JDO7802_03061 [Jannaschia donghaensis]
MRALLLVLLLPGCGYFRPAPVIVPFVPGCVDYVSLAKAVVDGRKRGQSRDEQRLLAAQTSPYDGIHRAMVESVYDWPRPTSDGAWLILATEAAQAAEARCMNRPAAALQGRFIP